MAIVTFNPYQPVAGDTCAICLEEMQNVQLAHECPLVNDTAQRVFHAFHRVCILEHMLQQADCPICRNLVSNRIQLLQAELDRIRAEAELLGAQQPPLQQPQIPQNIHQEIRQENRAIMGRFMRTAGWKVAVLPFASAIVGNMAAFASIQMGSSRQEATEHYYQAWSATAILFVASLARHLYRRDYL